MAVVLGVCAVAFVVAFPLRTDYVGHFLAGAGGTACLLGLLLVIADARPWAVLVVTSAAIAAGVGTEATVFKLAIFDAVDLANQSLGALMVACGLVGARRSIPLGGAVVVLGVLLLLAGFRYAFA